MATYEKHEIMLKYTGNRGEYAKKKEKRKKRKIVMKQLEEINKLCDQSETRKFHEVVNRMTRKF